MRFRIDKPYRAYPELNDHSDAECERLMVQARVRRGDAMWFVPLVGVGAMVVVVGMLGVAAALVVHEARKAAGVTTTFWGDPSVREAFSWALLAMGPLAVVLWVVVRRELIMRSVLNHLARARCPYCLFDLAGLRVEMGAVMCPECGQRVVLADEGLTPDDLLPTHGKAYRTWKPPQEPVAELPPIPLEPEAAPGKKKRIRVHGAKREGGA